MIFDPHRNVYIDSETGAVIPLEDGDQTPELSRLADAIAVNGHNNLKGTAVSSRHSEETIGIYIESSEYESEQEKQDRLLAEKLSRSFHDGLTDQEREDRRMAESLSRGYDDTALAPYYMSTGHSDALPSVQQQPYSDEPFIQRHLKSFRDACVEEAKLYIPSFLLNRGNQSSGRVHQSLEDQLYDMHSNPRGSSLQELENPISSRYGATAGSNDDWFLARTLQAMEFEMVQDIYRDQDDGDFSEKEYKASSCRKQMLTVSTAICMVQIGLLIGMIQQDGYAPRSENPLIGPPATTMVRGS
jgi:hypothetical protein